MARELQLPLVVLTVDNDAARRTETVAQARQYLGPYGLNVKEVEAGGDPYEQIMKICASEQCNLVAMGAYGHSPIRELILGSTTTRVMRAATCPVLLYR